MRRSSVPAARLVRSLAALMLLAHVTWSVGCAGCPMDAQPAGARDPAQCWVRTELYFGLGKPDGTLVSEGQWLEFLDRHISPRFPDGLTVLSGDGRYLDSKQVLRREPSKVVIILYPREQAGAADQKIRAIATEYATMFSQESVLRADGVNRVQFLPVR